MTQSEPATLADLVRARAAARPDDTAYTFLADGESREESLTCAQLEQRARAVAAALQAAGVAPGERALLLLPPGLDYIAAFFGSLCAGVVAVPVYAPHAARVERALARLRAVAASARPAVVLTGTAYLPAIAEHFAADPLLRALRPVAVDELPRAAADAARAVPVRGDALAFLQYTSGSTAEPRGVALTHANLLSNLELIRTQFGVGPDSRAVLWLPPYHDMGLIGGILEPLYAGFPVTLLSPVHFLQRPARWLEAIARTRASVSGGPNFAYEMCLRKLAPEQRLTLDLSSWTLAFNGAEPVRAETLERFAAGFAAAGFRREALRPCYGLAEATLLVAAAVPGQPAALCDFDAAALEQGEARATAPAGRARRLVGCGRAPRGQRLVIADPRTLAPCAPGRAGEIWVQGPSVARGYWGRPEDSARTFGAHLAGGEGPFLRTGDLGFVHAGELFVTGRLKDLIVVRGRNVHPQDVERSVERAHTALRPGCGAAFAVDEQGQERLVVAHEIERPQRGFDAAVVIAAVRQAVAEEHDAPLHALALLAPGTLPKTSSGKVQRQACRRLFLEGTLQPLVLWREDADDAAAEAPALPPLAAPGSREALEDWMAACACRHLRLDPAGFDRDAPLTRYGLDSISAVELSHAIEQATGRVLEMDVLLRGASVRALARSLPTAAAAPAELPRSAPAPSGAPLSHGQRALWFLQQLAPASPAYNVARAARLRGPLDASVLRRALHALVERHALLRTTYAATPAGPVQRTSDQAELAFVHEDASAWSAAALDERLSAEATRPFDLERGPVLRVTLLRRAEDEHVLLFVLHHIAVDFWSLALLVGELGRLYPALRDGRDPALPALPATYGDYVLAQQALLDGRDGARLLEFWRTRLMGAPPLELPTDRPRPKVRLQTGARHGFTVGPSLTARLRALAAAEGVTLYTLLLACWQTLLQRYTGQDDVVVGSPTAGRGRAAFAGIVGYFVNPVALRVDLAGDPSLRTLLGRTRAAVLDAFAHEDYPWPLLVEHLQPQRDPGRSPLFDVVFVLQKAQRLDEGGLAAFALGQGDARLELGEVSLEPFPLAQQGAQFDLTLTLAESAHGLAGACEYATELFDPAGIERLARHYETLLEAAVERPDARLSELPLLAPAERAQLEAWAVAPTAYPREAALYELFAEQAARAPEAVALVSDDASLTYAELDRRAGRLARRLRAQGVGPEERVGVLLGRSPEYVVAVLGVLAAGAAYVPLDPAYPQERLAFVAGDAGLRVVLTAERFLPRLPHGLRPLLVERDEDAPESPAELPRTAAPDSLAYVMYTSGSTGTPKGVAVTQRGVVRLVRGTHWERFGPEHTFLLFAPVAFDASTFELWGALLNGARLACFERGAEALDELGPALRRFGVTTLWLSAGLFHQMADAHPDDLRGLRQLLAGGDVLAPAHVRRVLERQPGLRFVNGYGPTENTTFSTCAVLTETGQVEHGVPIGTPVSNSSAYVLDGHARLAPLGVPGELYVGGDGLARGYLGRPDLTAERFLPDPFSGAPGARLYRTGDRVRWRAGGALEFLGRLDRQVKVRGFRVEPGEIEAALGAHPGVRSSVVLPTGDGAADKRLVAWVVPDPRCAPSSAELRAFLEERLPAHMLPSALVLLDALPLTPNGKLDRAALPRPEADRDATPFVAPRSVLEEVLAAMWCELLDVPRVGVHDGFFELGGHSLLATQFVARVRQTFQLELPLRSVFERPTVEGLAAALLQAETQPGRTEKIARAVKRMQSLSPEQAQRLLHERKAREVSVEA